MIKKLSFGILMGGFSLLVDGIVGLAMYPLLLKFLSKEIVGIWLLFLSFSVIVNYAQTALGPIVIRLIAEGFASGNINQTARLYHTVSRCYYIIFLLVVIILSGVYIFYISSSLANRSFMIDGALSWLFVCVGFCIRIFSIKDLQVINGIGEVGWDKVLQIFMSVTCFSGYAGVLYYGFGLKALGFVYLCSNLLQLIGSKLLLNRFWAGALAQKRIQSTWNDTKNLLIQSNGMLVLCISAFFVTNIDVYVIERFCGLEVLPLYSPLNKIVAIILAISLLVQQMMYPYMARFWAQHEYTRCQKIYWQGGVITMTIAIILSSFALIAAPKVIPLWLGEGNYLGSNVFGLQLLFGLLYIHQSAHASPVIATNGNNFVYPAVINALLAVPLSALGAKYFGIIGVVAGNILAIILPSCYVVFWSIRYFRTYDSICKVKQQDV